MIKSLDGTCFSKDYYYVDREGWIRLIDTGKVVGQTGSFSGPFRSYVSDPIEKIIESSIESHIKTKEIINVFN